MSDTGVEMDESRELDKLAAALAKAQVAMKHADPSREAGVTRDSAKKRKYATLADVMDAARPALSANGLSVVQHPSTGAGSIILTTWLLHESGQWMRSRLELPRHEASNMPIIWAMGTALSYARRYAYAAIVGVAVEDDDAQGTEVADEAHQEARRERESAAPAMFPNFGKMKGQPIAGAPLNELEYYLGAARKSLADPAKARFHAKESALIGALEAELARQRGSAHPKPGPAVDVYEEGMRMIRAASDPARVSAILKRAVDSGKLTKEQDAAMEVLARQRLEALKRVDTSEPSDGELDAMRYQIPPPPGDDDAPL